MKIAAATSKYISVNIDSDPVLFRKLSELISETIAVMRANRLSELEALKRLQEIKEQALKGGGGTVPEELQGKRRNIGIYHLFQSEELLNGKEVDAALMFDEILSSCEIVDWHKRIDIINKIELEFGDYLMDVMDLPMDKADELTKKAIEIAIASSK